MRINKKEQIGSLIMVVILAFIVITALAAMLLYVMRHNKKLDSSNQSTVRPVEEKSIATFNESKRTQIGTSGVSYILPNEWENPNPVSTYPDIFTYHRDEVAAELKADGRLPNANFYDDVKERKIRSYPFNLDKVYEIQIFNGVKSDPFMKSFATRAGNGENVTHETLGGKKVTDSIMKASGNAIAQRNIYFEVGDNAVSLIINPEESRAKITKVNFDGLSDFISLIK